MSMDLVSLYTKVPVLEAIQTAADKVFVDSPPALDRDTFVSLLTLAVTNIHFMACGKWFRQRDGAAMGSSLSVILANLWLSELEPFSLASVGNL